jgi:histone H3/H4
MSDHQFSYNHCYRILKAAGARKVSSEAVEELLETIENIALEISRRAVLFSDDSSRLMVKKEDLKNAAREFFRTKCLEL